MPEKFHPLETKKKKKAGFGTLGLEKTKKGGEKREMVQANPGHEPQKGIVERLNVKQLPPGKRGGGSAKVEGGLEKIDPGLRIHRHCPKKKKKKNSVCGG